jgi:hypothetical protein
MFIQIISYILQCQIVTKSKVRVLRICMHCNVIYCNVNCNDCQIVLKLSPFKRFLENKLHILSDHTS